MGREARARTAALLAGHQPVDVRQAELPQHHPDAATAEHFARAYCTEARGRARTQRLLVLHHNLGMAVASTLPRRVGRRCAPGRIISFRWL